MAYSVIHENHLYSVYFAPRGKKRMINLGMMLSQRHLAADDRLIGIIGEAGSGKSVIVKAMFPGLELSNDDDGVNVRPLPILNREQSGFFSSHTYHLDMRFEMAFTSIGELANSVRSAVEDGKRVIVEHFDLLYPVLGMNAELLVGVGEEVIITRPSVFGPEPQDIANIVFKSSRYRKMAHTAENLTEYCITQMGYDLEYQHGDVMHGFILEFTRKPDFDIYEVESEVKKAIESDIPVSYMDEGHMLFGKVIHACTGPRVHVKSTADILDFHLLKEFIYNPINKTYLLVGLVDKDRINNLKDLNRISF